MKNQLRTRTGVKTAAVLLAVAVLTGGFWASLFAISQWDDMWTGAGYYDSANCHSNMYNRYRQVVELARLDQVRQWNGGQLSYLEEQREADLKEALTPEKTNFRFRILKNDTGTPLYGNLGAETALDGRVHNIYRDSLELSESQQVPDDYQSWDSERDYYLLHVEVDGETHIIQPENAEQALPYGWTFNNYSWDYDSSRDTRIRTVEFAIEYGVADPVAVQDEFWEGMQDYNQYARYLPGFGLLALALDTLGVLLLVFLCTAAGRRRDRAGAVCNGFDRIPLDLLAYGEVWAVAILLNGGDSMTWAVNSGDLNPELVVGLALVSAGIAGCLLAFLLTLVTRIKTRTVFTNTLIWRLCAVVGRAFARMARTWPLTRKAVALFLLYLLGTLLTTVTLFLIPLYQGLVLYFLCRWTVQWRRVREGTGRIVGGDPGYKIDTTGKMYQDLREHAEQLNDLGGAIHNAVEEQLKSERFKAELITNVSHDLKTPLTSIINYVDLLKKTQIQDPKAQEYLEVLDRKSQRLKKLTEDLVEASKASTGSLSVNKERLGMVQMVRQAVGEFEEKFTQRGLCIISAFPPEEAYIQADGRHLWRIIDNLLSNCNKYALEGTRVYLDVMRWDSNVILSVKNVSKQQLNIPAEQLMERFVRGEESRSTEGSGLGLSIARSLTELQGGAFHLDIDGDLFKATVSFPEDRRQLPAPPPADALAD